MRLSAMRSAALFCNTVSNPCFRSRHVLPLQQNDPSETTPVGIRSRSHFVCLSTVTKKQIERCTDTTDTNQLHSMVCSWGWSFFELSIDPVPVGYTDLGSPPQVEVCEKDGENYNISGCSEMVCTEPPEEETYDYDVAVCLDLHQKGNDSVLNVL